MAAEVVLFLMLMSGSLAEANDNLLYMECMPAIGEVGKTTKISCSFKPPYGDINIDIVSISKSGHNKSVFKLQDNIGTGDLRFNLPSVNNPSLELSNTTLTDEGEYKYEVMTTRGIVEHGSFRISVTAKYSRDSKPDDNPEPSVTVPVVLVVAGIVAVLGLTGLLFRRKYNQRGRRPSAQPILRASEVCNTQDEDEDEDEDENEENVEADADNEEE